MSGAAVPPGGPASGRGLVRRAAHACAPLLAGAAIDAMDLATFGPMGLAVGWLAGGVVGWWLAPVLGFPARLRWVAAAIAGTYCALPMTGFLPLATFAAGLARLIANDEEAPPAQDARISASEREPAIDAEYRSQWEQRDPD